MPLYFYNTEPLNPLAFTTFGLSAKVTSSAIGQFGTGLKYAIAILLRTGGSIEIEVPNGTWTFWTERTSFRGSIVNTIYTSGPDHDRLQLPFTTHLGEHWKPWMAYRELWANAKDEGGGIVTSRDEVPPEAGTIIRVEGLDAEHKDRGKFLLTSQPLVTCPNEVEVHEAVVSGIYYQGILIHPFSSEGSPGRYSYNLLGQHKLTEDRTMANGYLARASICNALCQLPATYIREIFTTRDTEEASWVLWSVYYPSASAEVKAEFDRLYETHMTNLPRSLVEAIEKAQIQRKGPKELTRTWRHDKILDRSLELLQLAGIKITAPIVLVQTLGPDTMGLARDGKIYLSDSAFTRGAHYVAQTLVEEHIHHTYQVPDETREFQDRLLEVLITAIENLSGETF